MLVVFCIEKAVNLEHLRLNGVIPALAMEQEKRQEAQRMALLEVTTLCTQLS